MINPSDILGMNAREQNYTIQNTKSAKNICSSKYATKIILEDNNIPTANVYTVFLTNEDVNEYDWSHLKKNFVIKPTNGNAGKGVIAFKKKRKKKEIWIDTLGNKWSLEDLKFHCYDILEGQYSTYGSNHNIIIEERILTHPKLLKYSYRGTPDIRVIIYNSVPVMAMLRLPTKESEGRANITQGAIGIGIDMATGITTHAVVHKQQIIKYLPNSKKKLNGIMIPFWNKLLKSAIEAANIADLAFSGIDLFVHETKGPIVVELNANPGLSIQNANQAGLRRRLERVEDLNVRNPLHGVKIAQALFAEKFADQITTKDGIIIISPKEQITVYGNLTQNQHVKALINTGRYRSSISPTLAERLNLYEPEQLLWYQKHGSEKAPVISVKFKLKNKTIKTEMIVVKKLNKSSYKIEIGRKDLTGFLVGEQR